MSSIPTKQIDGDVAVGRNVSMGGSGTVRGSMTVGHNLTVEGWLEAKNIRDRTKVCSRPQRNCARHTPTHTRVGGHW